MTAPKATNLLKQPVDVWKFASKGDKFTWQANGWPTGSEQVIPCNGTSNSTHCLQNQTNTCVGYKENLLTLADKNYLLWVHTSLRENLTKEGNGNLPKAFFIKKISWNDELANMAQKWAENCSAKKAPQQFFRDQPLGQLVVTANENESQSLPGLVSKWTAGLKYLNAELIAKYRQPHPNESDYEPAAQMIWWKTSQLGCGRSNHSLKDCDEKVKNCRVVELVCNYFPAGNKKGEPIYINTDDNNLICQYDNTDILCKNINSENEILKKNNKSFTNRIRNKILELWPAAAGATSTWETRDVRTLYVFLLFTTLNLYYNILLRN